MIKINDTANYRKLLSIPYEQLISEPMVVENKAFFTIPLLNMGLLTHIQIASAAVTAGTDITTLSIPVPQGQCWKITHVSWETTVAIPTSSRIYIQDTGTANVNLEYLAASADLYRVLNILPIILKEGFKIRGNFLGIVAATTVTLRIAYEPIRSE